MYSHVLGYITSFLHLSSISLVTLLCIWYPRYMRITLGTCKYMYMHTISCSPPSRFASLFPYFSVSFSIYDRNQLISDEIHNILKLQIIIVYMIVKLTILILLFFYMFFFQILYLFWV